MEEEAVGYGRDIRPLFLVEPRHDTLRGTSGFGELKPVLAWLYDG